MADEVGNQDLESKADEFKEESNYKIVEYKASLLPQEFKSLIIAPFINSLRYGNDLFKLIDQEAYFLTYSRYIESLLKRQNSIVRMAMLRDKTVIGWCLFEDNKLHYVWVKKEARRKGFAKSIIPKDFDTITHITNKGLSIWASKFAKVRFNPFV